MNQSQEKHDLDLDEKPSTQYIECADGLASSDETGELEYPEALRNMPMPPSMETLLAGLEFQKGSSAYTLVQQCKQESRVILAAMPYIIAK